MNKLQYKAARLARSNYENLCITSTYSTITSITRNFIIQHITQGYNASVKKHGKIDCEKKDVSHDQLGRVSKQNLENFAVPIH